MPPQWHGDRGVPAPGGHTGDTARARGRCGPQHSAARCLAELQMMVEHHLCKQAQGEEEEEEEAAAAGQEHGPGCCHHGDAGDTEHSHSPGSTCPLARAQPTHEGGPGPGESE